VHQATIENIEIEINLKDASVASDAEVRILQAAQRHHRDAICALEDLREENSEQSANSDKPS
jgi:hypothetical protein